MKARSVLDDCIFAKGKLAKSIEDKNFQQTRIDWITCLSLLRAVGHVLKNVDSKEWSKESKQKLDERWNEWKKEPLFSEFIVKERNAILKEYDFTIKESKKEETCYVVTTSGDRIVTKSGDAIVGTVLIRELEKIEGFRKGQSPLEILQSAVDWWEKRLNDLEEDK
ncbi:MAG: hypothetical protein QNJ46_33520 [Leptolyngbyaceae cyanobacterium MO_188.B28]|nr:hypothetical protein [Leptolyngbyaceae cyanobacterium MO_188.B28]